MKSEFSGLPVIYLHQGEIYFGDKDVLISTVLGSCLSITMYSKKLKLGGISHCQLPYCYGDSCDKCTDVFKYVECTLEKMIEKFDRLKIKREEVEIKAFGGGDVLITKEESQKSKTIGKQNITALTNWMDQNKLKLTAYDIGGKRGRKIFFIPTTGEIFLKRINDEED
jgi:chemotaxis protein CheD